ncbi:hypothetical protein HanLR1_Chr10g0356281 [Helianthus annuus]|nr:hypothetical protein HanLR1_Chr10g0356281 [Helianthus annuus]
MQVIIPLTKFGAQLSPWSIFFVGVWRSILVFRLISYGFLLCNLWTMKSTTIWSPFPEHGYLDLAQLGCRLIEHPKDELHTLFAYVHLHRAEGEQGVTTLQHFTHRAFQDFQISSATLSTQTSLLMPQEIAHPLA